MVARPKRRPILWCSKLKIDQVAIANIISSSSNRISPGIGIGAFPERLLSFGTANTPQIKANTIGKPIAKKNLTGLSV